MYGLQACLYNYLNTLLLLHSVFMLSVVKMALKGEVGGHAKIVMEITLLIMENHGVVFLNFYGNPVNDKLNNLLNFRTLKLVISRRNLINIENSWHQLIPGSSGLRTNSRQN